MKEYKVIMYNKRKDQRCVTVKANHLEEAKQKVKDQMDWFNDANGPTNFEKAEITKLIDTVYPSTDNTTKQTPK